jgi:HPt (histidine-containing phosphotransfer) domain-containing protein
LTALFVSEANVRVTQLRTSLASSDPIQLRQAAHALCGSSSTLGATALAQLCADLAADTRAGELGNGEERVDALDAELSLVLAALAEAAA